MADDKADKGEKLSDLLDLCEFPRLHTAFSSIELLTLHKKASLLKVVKSLSNDFKIPQFAEEILLSSLPQIVSNIDYYIKEQWELKPELYFKKPASMPLICESEPVLLSDGEVRDITFKTKYEPIVSEYRRRFDNLPFARSVKAKYWAHTTDEPLGCVIAVHGWMLGDEKASALTLVPGYFYRMGLDVLVVELPVHGSRSTNMGSPLEVFPSIDPLITNESFAQSIFELRELKFWLDQTMNYPIIGLGLSLGAHVISLWAALDKIDAAICVSPLIDLPDFIENIIKDSVLEKSLAAKGYTLEKVAQAFQVTSPLRYPLSVDKNKVMIVAGKNDAIVPASHALKLCNHWHNPKMYWLEDGHIEQLVTQSTGEEIHNFLKARGLAQEILSPSRAQGKK